MAGVNKVILLGRLGKDPELKHTAGGQSVCAFSLATSENWTDKAGTKQERTEWHNCEVWGKLADVCNQYLAKGRQAYVEGKLQTQSWDGQDGTKKYKTVISVTSVQFVGQAPAAGDRRTASDGPANTPSDEYNTNFTADDIPF